MTDGEVTYSTADGRKFIETGESRFVNPGEWFVGIDSAYGRAIQYVGSLTTIVTRRILMEVEHA